MKTTIRKSIQIIVATLFAISCNEKLTTDSASSEISFAPTSSVMKEDTKSIIEGDNVLGKDASDNSGGFGVMGYFSVEEDNSEHIMVKRWINLFDNQLVTSVKKQPEYDGTSNDHWSWTYDPPKYWWESTFRFFAYYPQSATATSDGAKPQLVLGKCFEKEDSDVEFGLNDYTVVAPDAEGKQEDLLLAQPAFEEGSFKRTEPVNLKFYHALCQVSFTVVLNDQTTNKELSCTGVSVNDIYSTGNVKISCDKGATPGDRSTWAWPIKWSSPANRTFYPYTLNAPSVENVTIGDPGVETKKLTYTVTQYNLIMPQNFEENVQRVGIKIHDGDSGLTKDLVAYFKTAASVTGWEPGKKYIYNITTTVKSDDIITAVDIALTLAKWEDINIEATL